MQNEIEDVRSNYKTDNKTIIVQGTSFANPDNNVKILQIAHLKTVVSLTD